MKIILNKGYGGFSVSPKAHKLYAERLGKELFYYICHWDEHRIVYYEKVSYEEFSRKNSLFYMYSFKDLGDKAFERLERNDESILNLDEHHREDPLLIEIVEELGEEASGFAGTLRVVEIPDEFANGNYDIDDYDGWETLHMKVQVW